ncbi:MAG: RNA polymerase sigma factor [Treponema sp.]|uniref:RNA polymerase sigma factor n=1 Tax=Treponema sp. TaxID=166 RepID=UPI00298D805B|nr:RNA polymerase sigma factor [Treponema sp.]MCQ2601360.1 RNA polymerase sigma factor [Treponema sp.]
MKDSNNFKDIYNKYFNYVYNSVYAMVHNIRNTEDIVSETFLRAWNSFESYNPKLAKPQTWLCNIARNIVFDRWRSESKKEIVNIESIEEPAAPEVKYDFENIENIQVEFLLSKLTSEERSFLSMRYYMNMKNSEIAEELSITTKAVSERYRRLLEKCKKILKTFPKI